MAVSDTSLHKAIYSGHSNAQTTPAGASKEDLQHRNPGLLSPHNLPAHKSRSCESLSVHSLSAAAVYALCHEKGWLLTASCLSGLPPRARPASHTAACKPGCLHQVCSSAPAVLQGSRLGQRGGTGVKYKYCSIRYCSWWLSSRLDIPGKGFSC